MFDSIMEMTGLVLITLPIVVLILSFVAQLIFKKEHAIILINLVFWLIVTFGLFDASFLVYTFVYTLVSIMGIVLANLTLKIIEKP